MCYIVWEWTYVQMLGVNSDMFLMEKMFQLELFDHL